MGARNPQSCSGTAGGALPEAPGGVTGPGMTQEKPSEPTAGAILIGADADLQGMYREFWPDTNPDNSLAVPAQPLVSSLHSSRGIPRLLSQILPLIPEKTA